MLFRLAIRNISRNRRRSIMTASLVAMGALALLMFGAFTTYIFAGLETGLVQRGGHLAVYRSGYFLFGPGNPAAYGIDDYQTVMHDISADPVLHGLINVITPTQAVVGIAGNYSGGASASKTFFGIGLVGADQEVMRQWNEHGASRPYVPDDRLSDPACIAWIDRPRRGPDAWLVRRVARAQLPGTAGSGGDRQQCAAA